MRLLFVRHGEAHAGFVGPIAGPRGDRGLTDLGRAQARALGDDLARSGRIRADVLVTSILPRAIETAELIAPGLGLEISERDCDLCEVHTGEADGMDWAEYNRVHGPFDMEAEPDRPFAPGGESWNGFNRRVAGTLERLAHEHAGRTVVAVCHAGVIMASMRLLLGIEHLDVSAQLRPTNTGLTGWSQDDGRWRLLSFNETPHLPLAKPTEPSAPEHAHTLETARLAAASDTLDEWVGDFLASPGSDNEVLAEALPEDLCCWLGPVPIPLDRLHRLAGPPGAPVLEEIDEERWRDDVPDLAAQIQDGLEPPPVIASWRGDHLRLEDGNHRVEALRRAGLDRAQTIIGFLEPRDRESFDLERETSDPGSSRHRS